jgi:hypothetical protein
MVLKQISVRVRTGQYLKVGFYYVTGVEPSSSCNSHSEVFKSPFNVLKLLRFVQ